MRFTSSQTIFLVAAKCDTNSQHFHNSLINIFSKNQILLRLNRQPKVFPKCARLGCLKRLDRPGGANLSDFFLLLLLLVKLISDSIATYSSIDPHRQRPVEGVGGDLNQQSKQNQQKKLVKNYRRVSLNRFRWFPDGDYVTQGRKN